MKSAANVPAGLFWPEIPSVNTFTFRVFSSFVKLVVSPAVEPMKMMDPADSAETAA
jgi:hypothetical protein